MKTTSTPGPREDIFAPLRSFVGARPAAEQCDLCSAAIGPEHRHLLEVEPGRVICSCDPCALRFHGVISGRFRLIPRDVRSLGGFAMSDALWESLAIPISLAFFVDTSTAGRVIALYPGPAGITESLLTLDAWEDLRRDNSVLERMEPDVEALLVNRIGMTREYFLTPIDLCYELAGVIRLGWRGFSGGRDVWLEIDRFFERMRARAVRIAPTVTAPVPGEEGGDA